MPYPMYDGPEKADKGKEGGSCNRTRCQDAPALWYNHGSYAWYCERCRNAIEFDSFNLANWNQEWRPKLGHPMFETRAMMDAREGKISTAPSALFLCPDLLVQEDKSKFPDWSCGTFCDDEPKDYPYRTRFVREDAVFEEPEVKALKDAAEMVEAWWLEEEMHKRVGAPIAMFALRSALAKINK